MCHYLISLTVGHSLYGGNRDYYWCQLKIKFPFWQQRLDELKELEVSFPTNAVILMPDDAPTLPVTSGAWWEWQGRNVERFLTSSFQRTAPVIEKGTLPPSGDLCEHWAGASPCSHFVLNEFISIASKASSWLGFCVLLLTELQEGLCTVSAVLTGICPFDYLWPVCVSVSVMCVLLSWSNWLHIKRNRISCLLFSRSFLHGGLNTVHDFTCFPRPDQLTSRSPSRPPHLKGAVCRLRPGMWFDVVNWTWRPEEAAHCKKCPSEQVVLIKILQKVQFFSVERRLVLINCIFLRHITVKTVSASSVAMSRLHWL